MPNIEQIPIRVAGLLMQKELEIFSQVTCMSHLATRELNESLLLFVSCQSLLNCC